MNPTVRGVPFGRRLPRQRGPYCTPIHTPLDIDHEVYKWRHLIENFFCKLKEFKRLAMRSDKTDTSFEAMIHLSAALINAR